MKEDPKKIFINSECVCRRRKFDSLKLENYFKSNNFIILNNPREADYLFLETCGMRKIEEEISFYLIDKYKEYKGELIILGCVPDICSDRFHEKFNGRFLTTRSINKIDNLFPNFKYKFVNISDQVKCKTSNKLDISSSTRIVVSEGCLGKCSYCVVRFATGSLKSKPLNFCLNQYKQLINESYRNFEIDGEDVGNYGVDIGSSLLELLSNFSKIDKGKNVYWTLYNMDPQSVVHNKSMLAQYVKIGKIVEIKTDIQSGSEKILKLMNRYDDIEKISKAIMALKKCNNKLRLFSQAIVGFPGETDEDFKQTLKLLDKLKFNNIQLFSYGDNKRALSYKLPDKLSNSQIKKRIKYSEIFFNLAGYKKVFKGFDKVFFYKAG